MKAVIDWIRQGRVRYHAAGEENVVAEHDTGAASYDPPLRTKGAEGTENDKPLMFANVVRNRGEE